MAACSRRESADCILSSALFRLDACVLDNFVPFFNFRFEEYAECLGIPANRRRTLAFQERAHFVANENSSNFAIELCHDGRRGSSRSEESEPRDRAEARNGLRDSRNVGKYV